MAGMDMIGIGNVKGIKLRMGAGIDQRVGNRDVYDFMLFSQQKNNFFKGGFLSNPVFHEESIIS